MPTQGEAPEKDRRDHQVLISEPSGGAGCKTDSIGWVHCSRRKMKKGPIAA